MSQEHRTYVNINAVQKRERKRQLSDLHHQYSALSDWIFYHPSSHPEWQKKVQEFHAIGVKIETMEQN